MSVQEGLRKQNVWCELDLDCGQPKVWEFWEITKRIQQQQV